MVVDSCLVDTNILLRTVRFSDPQHLPIDAALAALASAGTILYYTQQNMAEFWNVMTRPVERNGFGFTVAEAEREAVLIERDMIRLPDTEATYREWRRIVFEYRVLGLQLHDARLVAAVRVHGVRRLLTLNVADFQRYEGITVLHLGEVLST